MTIGLLSTLSVGLLGGLVYVGTRFPGLPTAPGDATAPFGPVRLLDPFPPVSEVVATSASVAVGRVDDDESVIGLAVDGQARAYPVQMVNAINREIVNDTIAGCPVLVAWCGRCQAARAFERTLAARPLTFFVPGTKLRSLVSAGKTPGNSGA